MQTTAFQGSPKLKQQMLDLTVAHREADRIAQGAYCHNGKMCAVGCTLNSYAAIRGVECDDHSEHKLYDEIFGPGGHMLARLQGRIFEGLKEEKCVEWPERFIAAVRPGADLSKVGWKFLHWLRTDDKQFPAIADPSVADAIKKCADVLVLLTKGDLVDVDAKFAAESAEFAAKFAAKSPWFAAKSAKSAAESAELAAKSAKYAESAAEFAKSAAKSAKYAEFAAESAEFATKSAAWYSAESAAKSAKSAEFAAWYAEFDSYVAMADKFEALLREAE